MRRLVAVMLLMAAAAFSQDWSRVQALAPGKRVGVVTAKDKVEGTFRSASERAITIDAGREVTVPKEDIRRVYTRSAFNRWVRTFIGAGAGAATGALLNSTVGTRFSNEGQDVSGPIIGASTGIGAGIGALTGSGNKTIYER
jgi:hypothetical protein